MSSMREFLTSGRLGDVQLGLRPEQVFEILGAANDHSARRRPVQVLRYGAVEFAFKPVPGTGDARLVSTAIHFHDPGREVPPALRPGDWLPSNETTADEFRRRLDEAGLAAHRDARGGQETLALDSGASAVFDVGKLHSLHFHRRDTKPDRKQVTVSLPEDAVQRLKHRAREEGVSVHDLLERMIKAGT